MYVCLYVCMYGVPRISPKRNALAISKILHNIIMPRLGQRYYFQLAILFKRRNMGRIHFAGYFEAISIAYRPFLHVTHANQALSSQGYDFASKISVRIE